MIIKTKNYFTMNLLWNIKSGKQSCAKKTPREGKKLGFICKKCFYYRTNGKKSRMRR